MADKKITASLTIDTGQSKQNLEAVQAALVASGDAGTTSASAITNALQNIENVEGRVTAKISEGRTITVRDGTLMIQQFTILKQTIEQAFGSISAAPAAVQQAFAQAETQFRSTTATIKNLTTAATENRQAILGNANQWGGLEQQLLKIVGGDGALGMMILGFVGVKAALTEGIAIGTAFATAIGTNFEAAKSAAAALKTSIGSVTEALVSDGLWAAIQQGSAFFSTLRNTLTGTGKEMDGFNLLIAAGVDRTKALTVSLADLVAISYAHDIAVKGGTVSLKLFNDILRDADPEDYARRLGLMKGTFDDLAKAAIAHQKALAALKLEHDDQVKTIDALIKKHEAEIIKMGEVIRAIGSEEAARKHLHDTVIGEIDDAAKLDIAKNGTTASIQQVASALAGLTPEYDGNRAMIDKLISRLGGLGTSTIGISAETRKHIQATEDSQAAIKNLEGQNRTLQLELDNSVKAFDRLTPTEVADRLAKEALIDKNIGLIALQRQHITAQADELKGTTENSAAVVDSTKKVGDFIFKIEDLNTKVTNYGDNKTFRDSIYNLGQEFNKTTGSVDALIAKLRELDAQYKITVAASNEFAATMARAGAAASAAAGPAVVGGGGGGWFDTPGGSAPGGPGIEVPTSGA